MPFSTTMPKSPGRRGASRLKRSTLRSTGRPLPLGATGAGTMASTSGSLALITITARLPKMRALAAP